eukprot:323379-Pyramimonas_sp.AAC.1
MHAPWHVGWRVPWDVPRRVLLARPPASGSSNLTSRSAQSGLGCKGGLDPLRYRAHSRHDSWQFSTAQHNTVLGS